MFKTRLTELLGSNYLPMLEVPGGIEWNRDDFKSYMFLEQRIAMWRKSRRLLQEVEEPDAVELYLIEALDFIE